VQSLNASVNAGGIHKNQVTNLEHINKWEYTFAFPLEHVEACGQHNVVDEQGFPAVSMTAILGKKL
jgi:hypothetical protein